MLEDNVRCGIVIKPACACHAPTRWHLVGEVSPEDGCAIHEPKLNQPVDILQHEIRLDVIVEIPRRGDAPTFGNLEWNDPFYNSGAMHQPECDGTVRMLKHEIA